MKYPKFQQLSLADLESLYRLIDDGTYDGLSSRNIDAEARGYGFGHETWEAKQIERRNLLKEIRTVIHSKIKVLLDV